MEKPSSTDKKTPTTQECRERSSLSHPNFDKELINQIANPEQIVSSFQLGEQNIQLLKELRKSGLWPNRTEDVKNSRIDQEMKSTLFMINIVLNTKIKRLQEELEDLKDTLKRFKTQKTIKTVSSNSKYKSDGPKPKRKRKKKSEVERNYACNIDNCDKSYGSENSLNQHMKIKHPEFWMRIKEQEQTLTAMSSYNIHDARFPNPRAHMQEMVHVRNRSKLFGSGRRERGMGPGRLKMSHRRVEEVSDSEDSRRFPRQVEDVESEKSGIYVSKK